MKDKNITDSILEKLINKELDHQYALFNSTRQKEYSQEVIDVLEDILWKKNQYKNKGV